MHHQYHNNGNGGHFVWGVDLKGQGQCSMEIEFNIKRCPEMACYSCYFLKSVYCLGVTGKC